MVMIGGSGKKLLEEEAVRDRSGLSKGGELLRSVDVERASWRNLRILMPFLLACLS